MIQERLDELYESYQREHPNEGYARCGLAGWDLDVDPGLKVG